jgi:hypothetical protein
MTNTFSDWLCGVLVWTAIVMLVGLTVEVFLSPIINGWTALLALAIVLLAPLFWPKY